MAGRKKKTEQEKTQPTIIEALDQLWGITNDSELTPETFKSMTTQTDFLASVLQVNPAQCYLIAALIDQECGSSLRDLGKHAACSNLRMMTFQRDIDDLIERRMAVRVMSRSSLTRRPVYMLVPELLAAIEGNQPYQPRPWSDYTAHDVLVEIARVIRVTQADSDYFDTMINQIRTFLFNTQHLKLSTYLLQAELSEPELALFLLAVVNFVGRKQESIDSNDWEPLLGTGPDTSRLLSDIRWNIGKLSTLKLLECENDEGMGNPDSIKLTDTACREVLSELGVTINNQYINDIRNLIEPTSIKPKTLYYNAKEQEQIQVLSQLLSPEEFPRIQQRLRDANMRPGFACLFYGSPGTGKTETALQLSRLTGRPIMEARMSELRSKWVGESEKLVQSLFDEYAALVKKSDLCPILLLNEADAIISRRSTRVEHSVDKMENAIQNIILQAMERLEGILIATTNLTENMDPAFERRFLYKVRFDKPSLQAKSSIWQSMLPDLSPSDADLLAGRYPFSGGQIENIARKEMVNGILFGKPLQLQGLLSLCDSETITHTRQAMVGFR